MLDELPLPKLRLGVLLPPPNERLGVLLPPNERFEFPLPNERLGTFSLPVERLLLLSERSKVRFGVAKLFPLLEPPNMLLPLGAVVLVLLGRLPNTLLGLLSLLFPNVLLSLFPLLPL